MKVNSQIKLTNPQLLFVLCLNIYMAKYLRIVIRFLSAINGAQNNTSNCQSDLNEAEYYFFLGNIVLCGLNAGIAYVG